MLECRSDGVVDIKLAIDGRMKKIINIRGLPTHHFQNWKFA